MICKSIATYLGGDTAIYITLPNWSISQTNKKQSFRKLGHNRKGTTCEQHDVVFYDNHDFGEKHYPRNFDTTDRL